MGQQFIGYGSNLPPGPYLKGVRQHCIDLVKPQNSNQLRDNVTACMLATFTETDKVLFAARQYILTLWPAFVGAIVALAPDPAYMVYDNIWWAALFTITSGGLPGLDSSSSPPHHVEAHSESEGRTMCESWQYTAARPKLMSKTETLGTRTRGMGYVRLEWISFFVGISLWLAFCIYFGATLQDAGIILTLSNAFNPVKGALWYYISCSPAIFGAIVELLQNRVEIYDPVPAVNHDETQMGSLKGENGVVPSSELAHTYQKVIVSSVFAVWLRIAKHQWRRSKYRILIRDPSSHWFFLIGGVMTGVGRIAIFAFASIVMGNIVFLPVENDLYLGILLLAATSIPRQLWPAFWKNGNRGADLVVFVNSIMLTEVGPHRHDGG